MKTKQEIKEEIEFLSGARTDLMSHVRVLERRTKSLTKQLGDLNK